MFYLNKSASPCLLVMSTSRLDTSVPFASIALPSPSPSPSLSPPSLFLSGSSALSFLPLTSIAGIVSTSSCSAAACSRRHRRRCLVSFVRLPPPPPSSSSSSSSSSDDDDDDDWRCLLFILPSVAATATAATVKRVFRTWYECACVGYRGLISMQIIYN